MQACVSTKRLPGSGVAGSCGLHLCGANSRGDPVPRGAAGRCVAVTGSGLGSLTVSSLPPYVAEAPEALSTSDTPALRVLCVANVLSHPEVHC